MMEIRATRQPAWRGDGVEIRILDRERREYVKDVQMTLAKEGDEVPAAVRLRPEQAQALIDGLWECGLRRCAGCRRAALGRHEESGVSCAQDSVARTLPVSGRRQPVRFKCWLASWAAGAERKHKNAN